MTRLGSAELRIPFEVFDGAQLLRLLKAGRIQREHNELLPDRLDQVNRHTATVIVRAIPAQQTLISSHLFHPFVLHGCVSQGNAKLLIYKALRFFKGLRLRWWSRGESNP